MSRTILETGIHKVANVLDALPASVQKTAKRMLHEIRDAEDRDHAVEAARRFDAELRPPLARRPTR
jgi:transposase-like protein